MSDSWMSANRLQLNSDKTEFMWLTSPRRQHRLPTSGPLIGSNVVSPSATVRDLGVFIDEDLTTKTHVQHSVSMLCHLASVAKHPSLHTGVRLPFPCFCTVLSSALPYLASSFTCVADMPHRRRLRSASTKQLDVPSFRPVVGQLSEVVPFLLLEQRCGMACRAMLRRPRRCRCSRTG